MASFQKVGFSISPLKTGKSMGGTEWNFSFVFAETVLALFI
jgi:hypothetical protein